MDLLIEISKKYVEFKIGLLKLIGNSTNPLQIIDSKIFENFESVIYSQNNLKLPQKKTKIQNKHIFHKVQKENKEISFKSFFNKYQILSESKENLKIIQVEKRSHSLTKYDRIKQQFIKNQSDVEAKINQLTEQHNVQFVIFSNIRQRYKLFVETQQKKITQLLNSNNKSIGICKQCLKINQVQFQLLKNKIQSKKCNNFKSQIIQNQEQTFSQQEEQDSFQQNKQDKISNQQQKQFKELFKIIQKSLRQKKDKQLTMKNIQKMHKFIQQKLFELKIEDCQRKQLQKIKSYDFQCQTQNFQQCHDSSKSIGQRQLTLLIKEKQLSRKIEQWKLQMQNSNRNFQVKQNQLKNREKQIQIELNKKLTQMQVKFEQINQMHNKKSKQNFINDLKNKIQLDSYRRNALISIQKDQMQVLLQKQNISHFENLQKKQHLIKTKKESICQNQKQNNKNIEN